MMRREPIRSHTMTRQEVLDKLEANHCDSNGHRTGIAVAKHNRCPKRSRAPSPDRLKKDELAVGIAESG